MEWKPATRKLQSLALKQPQQLHVIHWNSAFSKAFSVMRYESFQYHPLKKNIYKMCSRFIYFTTSPHVSSSSHLHSTSKSVSALMLGFAQKMEQGNNYLYKQ